MNNINYSLKPDIPKIYLCNHLKSKIGILKHINNFQLIEKFAQINEVSFDMPYYIDQNNKKVKNKYIDEIKFLYTLLINGEYYVISLPERSAGDNKEVKKIKGFLLPYQLRNKLIFGYTGTKNALTVLSEVLVDTGWIVDHVSINLATKSRTFDESTVNVLDMLFKIEETFGAVLQFDTVNQKISLYEQSEFDNNKGFVIKYGKYLKTIEEYYDDSEICTRLYASGSDGLTISSISPTGEAVIENLTFFKSYMSPELLEAQNNYETLLTNNTSNMSEYVTNLDTYNGDLTTLQNQLSIYQIGDDSFASYNSDIEEAKYRGKYAIDDYLAVLNPLKEKTPEQQIDLTHYNALKVIIDGLISTQNGLITSKQSQITSVQNQITTVQNNLSLASNFTSEQLAERRNFIIESEYSDENIIDATTLLSEAQSKLAESSQPRVEYKIDSIDISQAVECQRDWDKLVLGDIITIKYPEPLNINVQVKIMEISHDYTDKKLTFTISNMKNKQFFEKLYKSASYASSTLSKNKNRFPETISNKNYVDALIENRLRDVVSGFKVSTNNSVEQSGQGIIIKDVENPADFLHLNNSALAIAKGGVYKTAISADGIVGEQIVGKQIIGVGGQFEGLEILNGDGDAITKMDVNGIIVKDDSGNERLKLGELSTGVYGWYAKNSTGDIKTQIQSDGTINAVDANFSGTVTATEIIEGTIERTDINNGNGTFHVDEFGNLTATSATISGEITGSSFNTFQADDSQYIQIDDTGFKTLKSVSGNWEKHGLIVENGISDGVPYDFGDTYAYYQGNKYFGIRFLLPGVGLESFGVGGTQYEILSAYDGDIYCANHWSFSGCSSVTGLSTGSNGSHTHTINVGGVDYTSSSNGSHSHTVSN